MASCDAGCRSIVARRTCGSRANSFSDGRRPRGTGALPGCAMSANLPAMNPTELKIGSYRLWVVPILRALDELGGTAPPSKIEAMIRKQAPEAFSDLQWARIIKGKYVRWAGSDLKKAGLLAGTGEWELTPSGRAHLAEHGSAPAEWPKVKPLDPKSAGKMHAALETVDVTDYPGYELPILQALAAGPLTKKVLIEKIGRDLEPLLTPGDRRIMNTGDLVFRYRASWALSNLKKAGEIRNPTTGTWEISDAGRARVESAPAGFDIRAFQDSKAKVRAEWDDETHASSPPAVPAWPTAAWKTLEDRFDEDLLAGLVDRVRPDLGPSPDLDRPLPRNVIFYGPPGTGKTFVAREIAEALAGKPEPDAEPRWSLVQFHPSYSYEDFVQGLRPDLAHRELRYEIRKGPFLQICAAAEKSPDTFFVLVIDEINRGDPARIFGELLYGLEYRGDAVDLPLGGQLRVPPNLVVIGTMNSVDRSVALVDYALRRRFAFVRVDPDPAAVLNAQVADPEGAAAAASVLETFNDWIVKRLDREHALGHSFFLSPALTKLDASAFDRIWRHDVHPLLEEYFFGQTEAVDEARKTWASAVAAAFADDGEDATPP